METLHAQVTAVPVSRQGSGVSVHELRLPSNNSAAACRVDWQVCTPIPHYRLGPWLRCSPYVGMLPQDTSSHP